MIASKTSTRTSAAPDVASERDKTSDRSHQDLFADIAGQVKRLQSIGQFYLQTTADLMKAQARTLAIKVVCYALLGVAALTVLATGLVFLPIAAAEWLQEAMQWSPAAAHATVGGGIALLFAIGLFVALKISSGRYKKGIRRKYDDLYREQRNALHTDIAEMAQQPVEPESRGA
jgi:hypothetical protein